LTECLDFFNHIINTSEKKIQAPYLTHLELLKRCQSEDLQYSTTSMNFMQYFSQFEEKGRVVGDLQLYLNLLTPKSKLELFEKVKKTIQHKI